MNHPIKTKLTVQMRINSLSGSPSLGNTYLHLHIEICTVFHFALHANQSGPVHQFRQKYQMGFFLQIIYLNGFVLKLFILWVSFYTTRRFSIGRVPQNGDTWHELRSGGLSDVVACQARPDVVACHSAKRGHTCWSTRRDHTCWSTRYFLSRLPIKLLLLLLRSICTTKSLK